MELDSVAKVKRAFFRLVGTESDDDALTLLGESANEVVELALTRGCRAAQRYMLDNGYQGWRKRSSAITWSGTDAADGGRYSALPTDLLRAYSTRHRSALVEANGDPWGREIDASEDFLEGDLYYVRDEQIWLARTASPPSTVYLTYHYLHPSWTSLDDADIDFPTEARPLIPAYAADYAKDESWLPAGEDMENRIARALAKAQHEARKTARRTKTPRQFMKVRRYGNHW